MFRRLLCISIAVILIVSMSLAVTALEKVTHHISVSGYDPAVDYSAQMHECLKDGSKYAIEVGYIYEQQRNLKIRDMGLLQYKETNYFSEFSNAEDILNAMEHDNANNANNANNDSTLEQPLYTDDDLYWLSRVVYAEAGCDWFPDWVQQAVASVVINRVKDNRYPDNIKDVIFQPGQYSCVNNGGIYNTPTEKVVKNCKYVLEHGSSLPEYVIGQSSVALGPVYTTYHDSILGTTIYFFSV